MNKGFPLKMAVALAGAMSVLVAIVSHGAVAPPVPAAPPGASPAPAPHIQFANTVLDFGSVKPTEMVKHDFVFTNTGNATLTITSVRPGCGCTTAGDWTHAVEPGQTGRIPIQFNPVTFSGNVAKSVTVTCDDPTQNTIYLQIKGSVWKPIDVEPRYAYFTVIEGSETNQAKVVRITNNTEEEMQVSAPEVKGEGFKAELKTVRPGKEYEVTISLVPPVESTRSIVPVTLKTTSTNMPVITISAYAIVQPAIQVMPPRVALPFGPLGPQNRYTVTIRNSGGNRLELTAPTINVEGAQVALRTIQPGVLFTVDVSFPAGFQVAPGRSVFISVKSNSTAMPLVRVPVIQMANVMPPPRPLPAPPAIARPITVTPAR